MSALPGHKTKIVATIGPASSAPATMERLIRAGMNVARLNFSHGELAGHARVIADLRAAARAADREIAIMADLPGPKMRVGMLAAEPIELRTGDPFTLTTADVVGDATRVAVSYARLPEVVRAGDVLFLNDGLIRLDVARVEGREVHCRVAAGGALSSRKGLNLPGIDLGESAFTTRDREIVAFAAEHGIDVVSQSFVDSAADVTAVREAAAALGYHPLIVAKIERARALERIDAILAAADGLMIARGDLGVEVPIERIAVVQKDLVRKALRAGKPVIIATQMLESMTRSPQPTRAEATDVANAILDGTDCVMLSAESAAGAYPVEAVATLVRIALATEPHRPRVDLGEALAQWRAERRDPATLRDLTALAVERVLEWEEAAIVLAPTSGGATPRSIARFRLPVWVAAFCTDRAVCRQLALSYGVVPVHVADDPGDWRETAAAWVHGNGLGPRLGILVQGPSRKRPDASTASSSSYSGPGRRNRNKRLDRVKLLM
jgi:pyruvate kinase